MDQTSSSENESKAPKKKSKSSGPSLQNQTVKTTRLLLTSSLDHPFTNFQNEIKTRGIKNADLNELVVLALEQVPEAWWAEKIEELTPLEYRVNTALENPDLRAKLEELLTPDQLKN